MAGTFQVTGVIFWRSLQDVQWPPELTGAFSPQGALSEARPYAGGRAFPLFACAQRLAGLRCFTRAEGALGGD